MGGGFNARCFSNAAVTFLLRSDFFVMFTLYETRNFSAAFNPSRLAHVEHTHAQGHTLMETHAIHWSGGQPFTAPGEHGVGCLLKGTSAMTRRWTDTSPAVSSPIFEWREWESNRQRPTLLTTDPQAPM